MDNLSHFVFILFCCLRIKEPWNQVQNIILLSKKTEKLITFFGSCALICYVFVLLIVQQVFLSKGDNGQALEDDKEACCPHCFDSHSLSLKLNSYQKNEQDFSIHNKNLFVMLS